MSQSSSSIALSQNQKNRHNTKKGTLGIKLTYQGTELELQPEESQGNVEKEFIHLQFLRYGFFDKKISNDQVGTDGKLVSRRKALFCNPDTNKVDIYDVVSQDASYNSYTCEANMSDLVCTNVEGIDTSDISNFDVAQTFLSSGYVYIINEDDPSNDHHEILIRSAGHYQDILWQDNKDASGEYSDIRLTTKGETKPYIAIEKGKCYRIVCSAVQWSIEVHKKVCLEASFRQELMPILLDTTVEDPTTSSNHIQTYDEVRIVSQYKSSTTSLYVMQDHLVGVASQVAQDASNKYDTLYLTQINANALAHDISLSVHAETDRLQAMVKALELACDPEDILPFIRADDSISFGSLDLNHDKQAHYLHLLAKTAYQYVYNDKKRTSEFDGSDVIHETHSHLSPQHTYTFTEIHQGLDLPKIEKILAVKERKVQRDVIHSYRDDLGNWLFSRIYQDDCMECFKGTGESVCSYIVDISDYVMILNQSFPSTFDKHLDLDKNIDSIADDGWCSELGLFYKGDSRVTSRFYGVEILMRSPLLANDYVTFSKDFVLNYVGAMEKSVAAMGQLQLSGAVSFNLEEIKQAQADFVSNKFMASLDNDNIKDYKGLYYRMHWEKGVVGSSVKPVILFDVHFNAENKTSIFRGIGNNMVGSRSYNLSSTSQHVKIESKEYSNRVQFRVKGILESNLKQLVDDVHLRLFNDLYNFETSVRQRANALLESGYIGRVLVCFEAMKLIDEIEKSVDKKEFGNALLSQFVKLGATVGGLIETTKFQDKYAHVTMGLKYGTTVVDNATQDALKLKIDKYNAFLNLIKFADGAFGMVNAYQAMSSYQDKRNNIGSTMQGLQIVLNAINVIEGGSVVSAYLFETATIAIIGSFWGLIALGAIGLALYLIEEYSKESALKSLLKNCLLSDFKSLTVKQEKSMTPYQYINKLLSSLSSNLSAYGQEQKYDNIETSYVALRDLLLPCKMIVQPNFNYYNKIGVKKNIFICTHFSIYLYTPFMLECYSQLDLKVYFYKDGIKKGSKGERIRISTNPTDMCYVFNIASKEDCVAPQCQVNFPLIGSAIPFDLSLYPKAEILVLFRMKLDNGDYLPDVQNGEARYCYDSAQVHSLRDVNWLLQKAGYEESKKEYYDDAFEMLSRKGYANPFDKLDTKINKIRAINDVKPSGTSASDAINLTKLISLSKVKTLSSYRLKGYYKIKSKIGDGTWENHFKN